MSSPIKPRPMMGMREFREKFPTLTDPVRVIRSRGSIEVIGDWIPAKREKKEAPATS
jgi:hypothetical protein